MQIRLEVFSAWFGLVSNGFGGRFGDGMIGGRDPLVSVVFGEAEGEFSLVCGMLEFSVEEIEFMDSINRFLRYIEKRERCIFINRYFHIESVKSIANKYNISENNVHKILSRTRIKLKLFLEAEGYTI